MPHAHSTTPSLPSLKSFSAKDRRLAERALSQREDQRRKTIGSRAQKIEKQVENVHRRLRDSLGAKKYGQLREGIQRERLAFRDRLEPPLGLNRDRVKDKRGGKRNIHALLRRLGVHPAELRGMVRSASAEFEALLVPDHRRVVPGSNLHNHLNQWTKLSPYHKFPLPWGQFERVEDPNDPHRWFLFRPPFFGFLFSEDIVTTGNFRANRLLHLHPPSGLVGNEATMDLDDSSNTDLAHVIGEAQIAVAFTPPKTGIVEVLIDAQRTIGRHSVNIEDEFGFSEAWCKQHNFLMMNVLDPNVPEPSLAQMSLMTKETGGDDLTASESLVRGQHCFAQLFSSGPVTAGQSVIITAGTQSFDVCFTNDMELHSATNFQWLIRSVEVRIAR